MNTDLRTQHEMENGPSVQSLGLQWNPSITDTIGNKHFVPCSEVSLTQGLPYTFSRHGSVKSSFEDNVAGFSELSLALRWQGVLSRDYYYELTPVVMVDNLARCLLNWDGFAYNWECENCSLYGVAGCPLFRSCLSIEVNGRTV